MTTQSETLLALAARLGSWPQGGVLQAEVRSALMEAATTISFFESAPRKKTEEEAAKTLRDEFAMAALSGLVARMVDEKASWALVLDDAYQAADAAMIMRKRAD